MAFVEKITTRYVETAQDGIIHHPTYAVYIEIARLGFLKSINCDVDYLEKERKFLCPVVDLHIRYLVALRVHEEIEVHVRLVKLTKVRFEFHYDIYRDQTHIAHGSTLHCLTTESMKVSPIPKDIYLQLQKELIS